MAMVRPAAGVLLCVGLFAATAESKHENEAIQRARANAVAEEKDGDYADDSTRDPKSRLCPDIDDPHGRWEGSKKVGESYKLVCAPGYEVVGTRGNGTLGKSSAAMVCPETLEWPQDLWCQNIDDCAGLTHGCGAMGVCMDLVNGYDCNCERGYPRRKSPDGEIVCGDSATGDVCGGHTCGSYGICIDLFGNASEFETMPKRALNGSSGGASAAGQSAYRCECVDGFYDNGETCVPHDCGALVDEEGIWVGSTFTGGQYTLKCFPGSSVWGGALQQITITCANEGKWLSHPVCVNIAEKRLDQRLEMLRYWMSLCMVVVCVCSAAMAAGLTLGFVSLDPFGLEVLLSTRPSDYPTGEERKKVRRDQQAARRMLPVIKDRHLLLVTLLLFNTVANEALPLFLDELVSPLMAVIVSVTVVLICGEILPSAIFTGTYQFSIASFCVPFVGALQVAFYPIASPLARLLDRLLPEDDAEDLKYSRAELRALLQVHSRAPRHGHDAAVSDSVGGMASMSVPQRESWNVAEETTGRVPEPAVSALRSPAEPSSGATVHFQVDDDDLEQPEHRHHAEDTEESDAPIPVLSEQEVVLIDGTFTLRESRIRGANDDDLFLRLPFCIVTSKRHHVGDIVPLVCDGKLAVVLIDVHTAISPTLFVRDVRGCMLLRDAFRGGVQPLEESRCLSRVLISRADTALAALQCLTDAVASTGIVVDCAVGFNSVEYDGNIEACEVLGVVTVTQLLVRVTKGDPNADDSGQTMIGSTSFPGGVGSLDEESDSDEFGHPHRNKFRRMRAGSRLILKRAGKRESIVKPTMISPDLFPVHQPPLRRRSVTEVLLRRSSYQDIGHGQYEGVRGHRRGTDSDRSSRTGVSFTRTHSLP